MKTKNLETLSDVEEAMNELQQLEGLSAKEEADANVAIAKIRQAVIEDTGAATDKAKRIRNSIEAFAEEHKNDPEYFPAGKRSIDLNAGTIAFKTGAPSVALAKGFGADDVLVNIKEQGGIFKQLVKTPDPELDKNAVKKLYDSGKISDADLKTLGLKITQSESLTIKLKTLDAYA